MAYLSTLLFFKKKIKITVNDNIVENFVTTKIHFIFNLSVISLTLMQHEKLIDVEMMRERRMLVGRMIYTEMIYIYAANY